MGSSVVAPRTAVKRACPYGSHLLKLLAKLCKPSRLRVQNFARFDISRKSENKVKEINVFLVGGFIESRFWDLLKAAQLVQRHFTLVVYWISFLRFVESHSTRPAPFYGRGLLNLVSEICWKEQWMIDSEVTEVWVYWISFQRFVERMITDTAHNRSIGFIESHSWDLLKERRRARGPARKSVY